MGKKSFLIAFILVALVGLGGIMLRKGIMDKAPQEQEFTPVDLFVGTLVDKVSATGIVEPKNRVEYKAPIAGRIETLKVREGDDVKQGQVIGSLSSTERVSLLDAALTKGPKEYRRWIDIYRPTTLVAPITGKVISRQIEAGQSTSLEDILLVFSDRLILKADVDETDVSKVKLGQDVEITLDAYSDRKISGTVTHIAYESTTVENVTVYKVEVSPNKEVDFMKSGMNAELTFLVNKRSNVLIAPVSALQYRGHEAFLFEQDRTGKIDLVHVKTGLSDGTHMEIIEGIGENSLIMAPKFKIDEKKPNEGSNPFLPDRSKMRRKSNLTKGPSQ